MTRDPMTGIRILDATLDYSDTSEDRVLATLEQTEDHSDESDELAGFMVDWPTRYHFSRMRGHLIRPLSLGPEMSVLDVGCGTGAVARALGERGCSVLGIEGALPRARAAALRCADLKHVEIACGDVSHLDTDRTFDLICLVGVLEYAASAEGGHHGPDALLDHLRRLVKPHGAILIAIENQIGLKYLLGYREDHVGLPWAGLEDYAEGFGARTWSRRQLGRKLTDAGFSAHRWLFPFPDYKLPSTILTEGLFSLPDAPQIVDQIVGRPVYDFAFRRSVLSDDRRVHRVLLDAGLGPEIANSFLVLAGGDDQFLDTIVDPHSLAWILGGDRRKLWKRTQVVQRQDDGIRVKAHPNSGAGNRDDQWLTQHPARDDRWFRGPTIEQLALDACHRKDETALAAALGRWSEYLTSVLSKTAASTPTHPFAPVQDGPVLPADMLDISPSNFVATDDGLVFIDREWSVQGGVDLGLAALRALWFFALDLVQGGARHPWDDGLTVDQICCRMAKICGFPSEPSDLARMHRAEAELQSLVIGFDRQRVTRDLQNSGQATLQSPDAICPIRWTHLHELPQQLMSNSATQNDSAENTSTASDDTAGKQVVHQAAAPESDSDSAPEPAEQPTSDHNKEVELLTRKIESLEAKNRRLEGLFPVKIYNRFRWWFSGS